MRVPSLLPAITEVVRAPGRRGVLLGRRLGRDEPEPARGARRGHA